MKKFNVETAVREHLIPSWLQTHLATIEGAVYGFLDPRSNDMVSTFQAFERGLLDQKLCLRVLAVQLATGGIVNPFLNHRVPSSKAVETDLIDTPTLHKAQDGVADYISFGMNGQPKRCTYQHLMTQAKTIRENDWRLLVFYPTQTLERQLSNSTVKQRSVHKSKRDSLRDKKCQVLLKTPFGTNISLQEIEDMKLCKPMVIDQFLCGQMNKSVFKEHMTPILRGKQPIAGIIEKETGEAYTVSEF